MRRSTPRPGVLAILTTLALAAALAVPATAARHRVSAGGAGFQGEDSVLTDVDRRLGRLAPTGAQRAAVERLGAEVRWNDFGTPQSLIRYGGYLGSGLPSNPAAAARSWLSANRGLFRLSAADVAALETIRVAPIGKGHAVSLRQRFGGVPAAAGGAVTVGLVDGRAAYVSSSLSGADSAPAAVSLSRGRAIALAARNVGLSVDAADVTVKRRVAGWTRIRVSGLAKEQSIRLVAVPTPSAGIRKAFQTFIWSEEGAFTHFIDARTGKVLIRLDEVDHAGEPKWDVFEAYPPVDYSSNDTRETWCWEPAAGCDVVIAQDPDATPFPWDVRPAQNSMVSFTSLGNNAHTFEKWNSNNVFKIGNDEATERPGRDYQYAWTNQWLEERCNPEVFDSPERNDIDAAIANLFVGHNRMHDWSYRLGFTEPAFNAQEDNFGRGGVDNDPESGNAQAGGVVGGPPGFESRDNANQVTPPDGRPPVTNMYLWQPIAGAFYAPCVDGDFDMTVIAHEYTHAISNRMVAGPDAGLSGLQAGAMGESWSDLAAMEILNEYGAVPVGGESPFAIGAYVTGDPVAGIRNYNMSDSPLNYSDVGYDITGPQVHADGEIWSATNFDIREAFLTRYPAGDQVACANGQLPPSACPGNRRWIQIVFDAWLLMATGAVDMLDARDAMLAADQMRFGGANQDLLWNAFAARGMGSTASSASSNDTEPIPSFVSPHSAEGTVTFAPVDQNGDPVQAQLFIGHYQARSTPVADSIPATPLDDTFLAVGGTYDVVGRGNGHGLARGTLTVAPGGAVLFELAMPTNLASAANGATATGDGTSLNALIDDTESTNWASLGSAVAGKQVTVELDQSEPSWTIDRVQVSALLRPQLPNPNPKQPNPDPAQSRFSALRQFRILTCTATGSVECSETADFTEVFTSAADAFPSVQPRPRAPDQILRSFDIPPTEATHVRLVVVTNQCTGGPDFQGDQDDDPRNITDCSAGSTQDLNVRAAELQVFEA
jgi:extracellular elastinolytic metalloproteinase